MNFDDFVNVVDENDVATQSAQPVHILTVSEFLNITDRAVKNFGTAIVQGEISELKQYSHLYFKIKDEFSCVDCLMWQSAVAKLDFIPKIGQKVQIHGQSSIYQKTGQFKLVAHTMTQLGLGQIMEKLRLLKEKLEREGIFDLLNRPIPKFVDTVGVITSKEGRVFDDICRTIEQRCDGVNVILYSAKVQGEDAPKTLIKALELANEQNLCDVLIIGRGGGSFEDLLPFSDEALVRAVSKSKIPIISAVGHEPDVALTDFASDIRAATPTAAATFVTSVTKMQLYTAVDNYSNQLTSRIYSILDEKKILVDNLIKRLQLSSPSVYISHQLSKLKLIEKSLDNLIENNLAEKRVKLENLKQKLEANKPLAILHKKQIELNDTIYKLDNLINQKLSSLNARLDFVATVNGLNYALDAKATNLKHQFNKIMQRLVNTRVLADFEVNLNQYQKSVATLEALNPLSILKRGYSITFDSTKKSVDIDKLKTDEIIETKLYGGSIKSKVVEIIKE